MLYTAGFVLEWKKWLHPFQSKMFQLQCLKAEKEGLFCNRSELSNLSRLQKACITALWSHDTLISSFMKPATSPLTHRPIKPNPIRGMWGRDEIGLFNSLYRNMLMQDNDSLIACYYGIYWRPNMRAVTEMMAWYMKMQSGPLTRGRIQLLLSGVVLLSNILWSWKWRLMSCIAVINILMVLSKTLQITFFKSILMH